MAGPTFLLVGNGPFTNRGCEAIVRGTVEILSARFPEALCILSSFSRQAIEDARHEADPRIEHRPHGTLQTRKYGLGWWEYRVLRRRSTDWRHIKYRTQYEAMQQSVCALEVGGDNYSLEDVLPLEHMEMDELLFLTGKPVVLWGASIGPAEAPSDQQQMTDRLAEHLRKFSLICARETATVDFLESIGIVENVRLVADPAFLLKPQPVILPQPLEEAIVAGAVGINLSPFAGSFSGLSAEEWGELASKCIASVAGLGLPVLLIPHVTIPAFDDHRFLLEAAERTGLLGDRVHVVSGDLTAAQYKHVISRLRAFVGARTHSTIAAISSFVPTISIGYSVKARGINSDVYGTLDWLIPVTQLAPEVVAERVKIALGREDELRAAMGAKVPMMVDRALKSAEYLEQVISSFPCHQRAA